jgi:D-alanyl-D-alanine carboxypeptidase
LTVFTNKSKRMKKLLFLIFIYSNIQAQNIANLADSIRIKHEIPALAYAVIKPDSILFFNTIGFANLQQKTPADFSSHFALGSCTKSLTSLIAAKMVSEGKIAWKTLFFDLFPELKAKSNEKYVVMTLQDLLTHRAYLRPLSGQNNEKMPEKLLADSSADCRLNLAKWVVQQPPFDLGHRFHYSNAGYTLAGLMLEKASGMKYEELTIHYLKSLSISPLNDYPNSLQKEDIWFHNHRLKAVAAKNNYDSGCGKAIAPAGLVFMNVEDAAKYLQIHLKGILGKSDFLPKETFEMLHFGMTNYAFGWANQVQDDNRWSGHQGSIGGWSFCDFRIYEKDKMAIVVMANAGTQEAQNGVITLRKLLYQLKK